MPEPIIDLALEAYKQAWMELPVHMATMHAFGAAALAYTGIKIKGYVSKKLLQARIQQAKAQEREPIPSSDLTPHGHYPPTSEKPVIPVKGRRG